MPDLKVLPTSAILTAFGEAVAQRGGTVTDTYDDGNRLVVRSVLPGLEEVRPGDKHQGGVALRSVAGEVWVHPYLFRLVCKNGAIMAQSFQSRHLELAPVYDADVALQQIREAVVACSSREVFAEAVTRVRSTIDLQGDMAMHLISLMHRLQAVSAASSPIFRQILDQFFGENDHSRFGQINAITAVAREVRDPEVKWAMEEYAGSLAYLKDGLPASRVKRSLRAVHRSRWRRIEV